MINPQDINLKELEDKEVEIDGYIDGGLIKEGKHFPENFDDEYKLIDNNDIKQFLSDKLNRIEEEIKKKIGEWEEFDEGMDYVFKILCNEFTDKNEQKRRRNH